MNREPLLAYILRRCIVDEDECWLWQGALNGCGVPVFQRRPASTRSVRAAAWIAAGNGLQRGRVFAEPPCHARCCNPSHALYVTRKQAMRRAAAEGWLSSGAAHRVAVASALARRELKLTAERVAEMRRRYAAMGNAAQIAREFGISHGYAHRICTQRARREPNPFAL